MHLGHAKQFGVFAIIELQVSIEEADGVGLALLVNDVVQGCDSRDPLLTGRALRRLRFL